MLKNKPFILCMLGRSSSVFASGMQAIVLPLYILNKTGQGSFVGIYAMLSSLPLIFALPVSGAVGDSRNRKTILYYTEIFKIILHSVALFLAINSLFNIGILFVYVTCMAILEAFLSSAYAGIIPDIVENKDLIEANSIKSSLETGMSIAGPILCSFIYGEFGIKFILAIALFCSLVAFLSIYCMYYDKNIEYKKLNLLSIIKVQEKTFKFVSKEGVLLAFFVFILFSNAVNAPIFDVIYPYILDTKIKFEAFRYTCIMLMDSIGVLLGNILIQVYFTKFSSKRLIRFGVLSGMIASILCSYVLFPYFVRLDKNIEFVILAFVCICMGILSSFVTVPLISNLQKVVPDKIRSSFFSLLSIFSRGIMPLSCYIFGVLLDKVIYTKIIVLLDILIILSVIYFYKFVYTKMSDE